MRAIVFDKQLALREVPHPVLSADEALLKIRVAGICNTDLELTKGYKDFSGILGHEFVAEIVEGIPDKIGQRVVGEINVACGDCDFCTRQIPSQCRNRSAVGIFNHNGAFADYLALTVNNLHDVPDSISDEQAVFTEPLAAACQILKQVHIQPDDNVVVIGAGKLGLLCAQVIKLTGANLSVIVRHNKQAQLLEKWGIRAVYREDLANSHSKIVVDCTGDEDGFADALDLVEPRGTIVLKSTYEGLPQADLTRIAVDEITIVGSRCGSFTTALRYLESGLVDVISMIDAQYSLGDAVSAIQYAGQKGVLKVLLRV
jgi:threonine dehydrogenase-like Zn-dependent dehydrogenase